MRVIDIAGELATEEILTLDWHYDLSLGQVQAVQPRNGYAANDI
jgi:hypothetical protein